MRKKSLCTLITFPTTTAALGAEAAAEKTGFGGHLIPVPREIRAGCGMALHCGEHSVAEAETFVEEEKIRSDGIYQILL